jgi:hypothetical protein
MTSGASPRALLCTTIFTPVPVAVTGAVLVEA